MIRIQFGKFSILAASLLWLLALTVGLRAEPNKKGRVTNIGAPPPSITNIYVSTIGDDSLSGLAAVHQAEKKAGPFKTLARARAEIAWRFTKGMIPSGGFVIHVAAGTYEITEPIALDRQCGGTINSPLVIRGEGPEKTRLIGGVRVKDWKGVDDPAVVERLDMLARGRVVVADLKAMGITDYGEMKSRGFGREIHAAGLELFYEYSPMTLAQWPNGNEWSKIAAVPEGQQSGKFTYDGDRPSRWLKAEDAWIHGYWTWDWADSYEKIAAIDSEKKEIATVAPHGVYGYTEGKRWRVINVLEELDSPGEWWLDRAQGKLYFWPPVPIEVGEAYVSISPHLFKGDDASNISIEGMTLEITRDTGVVMREGEQNKVRDCVLRNMGTLAVNLSDTKDGLVENCRIHDTGDGGVAISGGDRKKLTPGNVAVRNNEIFNYSRWSYTYRPGVSIDGVANTIANNYIHDAHHSAIILHGNDHVIEYNDIHRVCMETSDAGAFYLGRDWTERGNIVRYNYFRELGHGDVMAIYFDDCASGNTAYGNICYKAGRAVLIGGGRDNTIENNIFIECTPAVHVDARGKSWASFWFDGKDPTLMDRLKAMNYAVKPYSERYPELLTLLGDDPAMPKGNLIARNIFVGERWLDLLDGLNDQVVKIESNFTEGDPGFGASVNGIFQLRDDSPAYALGFKKIPVEKIGRIEKSK